MPESVFKITRRQLGRHTQLIRPVTSLENQEGRRVFWEGPKFF